MAAVVCGADARTFRNAAGRVGNVRSSQIPTTSGHRTRSTRGARALALALRGELPYSLCLDTATYECDDGPIEKEHRGVRRS
jgi:hypothetical protein